MTDTDRLSTPADLVEALKRLTTIMREIEALPDAAQKRFWEELRIPATDLRIGADVSLHTANVLYNILSTMCGPRLAEMLNGEVKEYYDRMLAEMQTMQEREWDALLDQKFAATKGTDHEGSVAVAEVAVHTLREIGGGRLRRVDGAPKLLMLTDEKGRERYFPSKDIIALEFEKSS
ncbi:MAG TPA: hypothetical protein VLE97_10780 [Gaiellaceae bacterium]|nr:hypothetical protein [Gaiellaceae bacterium]